MQYDVFISYSRKDYVDENGNVISGNIVSRIKEELKANGISYWFDEDGVNSGDEFAQLITNSIKNSKVVLFISTVNSNQSEWTRKEIATAVSYKKKIIPFRYDETPFNDSIYLYLADLDFISYSKNGEKALDRMVSGIKRHLKSLENNDAKAAKMKKIHEFESEQNDLNDSRKLMLIEIDKSAAMLDSLKVKYNDTVDKINNLEKEICRLDDGRVEHLVEKLAEKKEPKPVKVKTRSAVIQFIIIASLAVYAIVLTIMNFPRGEKIAEQTKQEEIKPVETMPVETKPEVKTQEVKKTEAKTETKQETKPVQKKKEVKDTTVKVKDVEFDMIAVKGGTFEMGATAEQGAYAENNERPAHTVTISDFCIGKYEVTQKLWKAVMGVGVRQQRDALDHSLKLRGEDDNMPMYYVSWDDCQQFIKKLNALTGKKFRLPTEAEWEYAARGGVEAKGMMFGSSNNAAGVAWYEDNSEGSTHVVGAKAPNALGLYDMLGNIGEWCQDRYGKYSSGAVTNPKGPSSGYDYVVRGGSWANTADNCRVSSRSGVDASVRSDANGLRLVLE